MSAVLAKIPAVGLPSPSLTRLQAAASEDLLILALLHDRELDRELIHALWRDCYEDFLGLRLQGGRAAHALGLLREGLTEIPTELCQATLDRLAADYADIYLTYGLRASPCESVWLDDDNLTLQEPTFRVRAWYRRYGLAVADWRKRSDDHLVYELRFLAHLLDGEAEAADLTEVARFMDEHPLRWVPRFAERVAGRCGTQFYAGLALLTAAYLDELRDLLAELIGIPRPTPEELAASLESIARPVEVAGPYLPGVAPSW
jgi:TorA maturation chaperone TorD